MTLARYTPGIIPHSVFYQHQVWVDIHGKEHEIESMDKGYIGNVILFLRELSITLYTKELLYRGLGLLEDTITHGKDLEKIQSFSEEFLLSSNLADDSLNLDSSEYFDAPTDEDIALKANTWLENTVLMQALLRSYGDGEVEYSPWKADGQ